LKSGGAIGPPLFSHPQIRCARVDMGRPESHAFGDIGHHGPIIWFTLFEAQLKVLKKS
jgi:hypothetical protein